MRKTGHHPDYFLLALVVTLTILGLVILASASLEIGTIRYGDSYYFLKRQLLRGLLVGAIGMVIAMHLHYQHYRKFALVLLLANLGLLVAIFTDLGISTSQGATRWLSVGPVSFQPSELLKITYIIYLAAWLTNPKVNRVRALSKGLVPFLIISGVMALLLIKQPATTVVIILFAAGLTVYFVSGISWKHLASVVAFAGAGLALIVISTPYRLERVKTFLNPSADTAESGYQINQAMIAIGSGGVTGIGYGKSTSKIAHLPAPLDDSIFAIAAQELGFIGAAGLVTLFGALVFRLLWLARQVRDRFGQLTLIGFATIIGLQSIINMGAISGLIPLTGVPLPFISYGGTALAVFLVMSGIALNISKYT